MVDSEVRHQHYTIVDCCCSALRHVRPMQWNEEKERSQSLMSIISDVGRCAPPTTVSVSQSLSAVCLSVCLSVWPCDCRRM